MMTKYNKNEKTMTVAIGSVCLLLAKAQERGFEQSDSYRARVYRYDI